VGDVIGVYDDFWVLLNEAWPQTLPDRYYIRTVLQHVSRKAVSVLTANDGSSGNRLVELFAASESVKGLHRTSV
jgi:hypothetical protein